MLYENQFPIFSRAHRFPRRQMSFNPTCRLMKPDSTSNDSSPSRFAWSEKHQDLGQYLAPYNQNHLQSQEKKRISTGNHGFSHEKYEFFPDFFPLKPIH